MIRILANLPRGREERFAFWCRLGDRVAAAGELVVTGVVIAAVALGLACLAAGLLGLGFTWPVDLLGGWLR